MKRVRFWLLAVCLCAAVIFGSCGKEEMEETEETEQVASSEEMAEVIEVEEEGMEPIPADDVKDGVYEVEVDSSSPMFSVESCQLTVKDGEMTALMTMGGTGYLYLYMGTGAEAAEAEEEAYIPYQETDEGVYTFEVPVEALDQGISCAAFSKRKEKWYDRQILFRADSLPLEAFSETLYQSAEDLGMEDGTYTAEVALAGGSGKASVSSPARLSVADGQVTAEIVWSSSNYDYMIVDEEKYLPVSTEGGSVFQIPVEVFDWKIPVRADTTAMSEAHEIAYTLRFDSKTLEAASE